MITQYGFVGKNKERFFWTDKDKDKEGVLETYTGSSNTPQNLHADRLSDQTNSFIKKLINDKDKAEKEVEDLTDLILDIIGQLNDRDYVKLLDIATKYGWRQELVDYVGDP